MLPALYCWRCVAVHARAAAGARAHAAAASATARCPLPAFSTTSLPSHYSPLSISAFGVCIILMPYPHYSPSPLFDMTFLCACGGTWDSGQDTSFSILPGRHLTIAYLFSSSCACSMPALCPSHFATLPLNDTCSFLPSLQHGMQALCYFSILLRIIAYHRYPHSTTKHAILDVVCAPCSHPGVVQQQQRLYLLHAFPLVHAWTSLDHRYAHSLQFGLWLGWLLLQGGQGLTCFVFACMLGTFCGVDSGAA